MLCDSNSAKYLKINSYFYILILKFLWKRNWKWVFEAIFCCYIYCEISIFCVCANFLKPLISLISCSSKVSNLYKNEIDLILTIPFVSVFLYDYVWLFLFLFCCPNNHEGFPQRRGRVTILFRFLWGSSLPSTMVGGPQCHAEWKMHRKCCFFFFTSLPPFIQQMICLLTNFCQHWNHLSH